MLISCKQNSILLIVFLHTCYSKRCPLGWTSSSLLASWPDGPRWWNVRVWIVDLCTIYFRKCLQDHSSICAAVRKEHARYCSILYLVRADRYPVLWRQTSKRIKEKLNYTRYKLIYKDTNQDSQKTAPLSQRALQDANQGNEDNRKEFLLSAHILHNKNKKAKQRRKEPSWRTRRCFACTTQTSLEPNL